MHIATKSSKIDISSEKKLDKFSKKLINDLKSGDIFLLFGKIGVGKTTFVKFLINNLQKKFEEKLTEVTSPTFNILNEYSVGNFLIKHYDLYRVNSNKEIEDLDLFDKSDKAILLVEWPQMIKQKPDSIFELYFEYENDYQNRFINFEMK